VEEAIHAGSYNQIAHWKYDKLPDVLAGEEPEQAGDKSRGERAASTAMPAPMRPAVFRCRRVGEVAAALTAAVTAHKEQMVFIVAQVASLDCQPELIAWSSHVTKSTSRPPAPSSLDKL